MTVSQSFQDRLDQFDIDLGIIHHFSSGVYAKQMHLPAGYVAGSHSQDYDHLSILAKGKVVIRTDLGEKTYSAPICLTIAKNMHHEIYALEDTTWFCIHATEETDPLKVDEVLIQKEEV